MKKILLSIALVPLAYSAQIGINTPTPSSTLDITAKDPTGTATTVDGVVIPRVDRLRAQNMSAVPTSTLIYINDISTGTAAGTTIDVTSVGFYHFDGTKWVALITTPSNNDWRTTGNTGTSPATNFIGTRDNQPLLFKTNNINSGFIGTAPNFSVAYGTGSLPYNAVPNLGNSAFGGSSLGLTTTGTFNSAFGLSSLGANTSGNLNTAIGYQALLSNTIGVSNTAVGVSALRQNISGQNNTAVGFQALQDTTGGFNTAFGRDALRTATTGIENIGIGYQAGFDSNAGGTNSQISTGSRNILLGMNTGLPNPAGNDQMNIGNIIFGTNVNGTLANPKGNIGLGTSNPTAKVEIASGTTGISGLKFTNINNTTATTANAAALGVDASGNVVIQNIAPLTTTFKSFSIDANSATNSLVTIGSLQFRYPLTTCTNTNTFVQVRSTTGVNNLGVQHAMFTTAQSGSGFVNTTPLTVTTTFADIAGIPLNCVQDGHAQFNFFSYTDRTFYRVNVHVADEDSMGFGALGYIFVELQK
jgi:hypothetical protein